MNKLKLNYYVKRDKKKDGKVAIYGKIEIGGTDSSFSTGKYISSERWIATNHLRNALRIDNEKSLKDYLDSYQLKLEKAHTELLKTHDGKDKLTATYFKSIVIDAKPVPEKQIMLSDIVTNHIKHFNMQVAKGDRASGSVEKYVRMGEVLKAFLLDKHRLNDIEFNKIDSNFVYALDDYLRFERKHGEIKGIANNTTVKYIKNISVIINHSIKRGLVKENPFDCYDVKLNDVDTVYLTTEELARIESKTFSIRRLEVVKDIFLFSCYTGYAPVDAMKLTWNNIITDAKGDMWIMASRTKTKIQSNIPVRPTLKKILNKYKEDPECIETERILPLRSNAKTNGYLKEIADLCGIEKNLTWYVSRHTFATTVTLANKVSMETVSKMMGHKRITQTQHYGKILDDNVKDEMLKVN